MIEQTDLLVRWATPKDANRIESLIVPEFERFLSRDYTAEGREIFRNYIMSEAIAKRLTDGDFALFAEYRGNMIGYIEVDVFAHLSLLFVDQNWHRNGIGKYLFQSIVPICHRRTGQKMMTVNASRYAREAYEKLGFIADGNERVKDGIPAIPMAIHIGEGDD